MQQNLSPEHEMDEYDGSEQDEGTLRLKLCIKLGVQ